MTKVRDSIIRRPAKDREESRNSIIRRKTTMQHVRADFKSGRTKRILIFFAGNVCARYVIIPVLNAL